MPARGCARARHILRTDGGSISVLAVLLIPLMLLGVGAAIDLNRAQGLQEMARTAAEGAARAVVRGASDAQADAYVHGLLDPYGQGAGDQAGPQAMVTVRHDAQTSVTVVVDLPLGGSFAMFRAMTGQPLAVSAAATARFPCTPPAPRWTPTTQACPAGQAGMISFDQEEQAICVSADGPVTWAASANRQNYSNTCTAS